MTIRIKLILLFLLIILPLIFVPLFLYRSIQNSLATSQTIIHFDLPVQNNSRELEKLVIEIHSEYQAYLTTNDEKKLAHFMDLSLDFNNLLERQKKLVQGNYAEARRLNNIGKLHNDWLLQAGIPGVIIQLDENKLSPARAPVYSSDISEPVLTEIRREFRISNSELSKLSLNRKIQSEKLSESILRILIITLALDFAGFAVFLLITLKMYVDPLYQLIRLTRRVGTGDLTKRASVHSSDELGELETAFNTMLDMVQQSNIQLEGRIQERTAQLADNMQILEREKAKDEVLLSNIGEGIIATDTAGSILFINKSACDMLGWTPKEMIGNPLGKLIRIEDESGNKVFSEKQMIVQTLTEGKRFSTTINTPFYWLRKDGSRFPAAITATPIKSGNNIIGAIIVLRDFTKEKEIDTAKNEFVSLASHQLRTPLSIINWYSEMFASGDAGKMTKKQQKYIDEILHANERMIELVGALLNVSRIDLGTFMINSQNVNIISVADKALSELKNTINEKKLVIHQQFPQKPVILKTDQNIMMIIFQNLLTNAVKYTPAGGKIEFEITEKNESQILIRVSDTGYGIPKQDQEKIFTKLYRADNVRIKDTEGTGLGLYLVKAVLAKIGGSIRFESEENRGTTFYVTLAKEKPKS